MNAKRLLREKLEARFIPEPMSGCFLWLGALNDSGYGVFGVRIKGVKRQRRAHRLYYELEKGHIPKGLTLDHLCRNRCCVNPSHLEPVTLVENVMRGENFFAQQARQTHCPEGHPYTGLTLRIQKGARVCRICVARRAREYYWRQKEKRE